jgi:hypothetical protein
VRISTTDYAYADGATAATAGDTKALVKVTSYKADASTARLNKIKWTPILILALPCAFALFPGYIPVVRSHVGVERGTVAGPVAVVAVAELGVGVEELTDLGAEGG